MSEAARIRNAASARVSIAIARGSTCVGFGTASRVRADTPARSACARRVIYSRGGHLECSCAVPAGCRIDTTSAPEL